jgi:hypothetical protein
MSLARPGAGVVARSHGGQKSAFGLSVRHGGHLQAAVLASPWPMTHAARGQIRRRREARW